MSFFGTLKNSKLTCFLLKSHSEDEMKCIFTANLQGLLGGGDPASVLLFDYGRRRRRFAFGGSVLDPQAAPGQLLAHAH